jgi:hypothetical protein
MIGFLQKEYKEKHNGEVPKHVPGGERNILEKAYRRMAT